MLWNNECPFILDRDPLHPVRMGPQGSSNLQLSTPKTISKTAVTPQKPPSWLNSQFIQPKWNLFIVCSVLKVCLRAWKALFSWQLSTPVMFYACKVALFQGAHSFSLPYTYILWVYMNLTVQKGWDTVGQRHSDQITPCSFSVKLSWDFSLAACVVWVKSVVFLLVNTLSWIQRTAGECG